MYARRVTHNLQPARVLYDGDCGVCTVLAEREAAHHSPGRFEFVMYQSIDEPELAKVGLSHADCRHELQLIASDGRVHGGAWAINRLLIHRFPWSIVVAVLYLLPVLLLFEWAGYRLFVRNRHVVSRWLGIDACRVP